MICKIESLILERGMSYWNLIYKITKNHSVTPASIRMKVQMQPAVFNGSFMPVATGDGHGNCSRVEVWFSSYDCVCQNTLFVKMP